MNAVGKEDAMVRKMLVVLVGLCLLGQTAQAAQVTGGTKENNYWGDAGYGTLAVFANLLYMPVKVVYASLGLVTGSLAYVLTAGNVDTAQQVWSPSVGGSYIVTPAMLRGDDPVLFNGPSYSND
jgi:hypothetical protein